MQLRNALLFALALDATPAEVEALHDAIDRAYATQSGTVTPQQAAAIQTEGSGAAPAATTPADTGKPEGVDAEGLPWDERIHSSNQKKTDKGVWVARRGVDDAKRAQIKAEIRATMGAAPATTQPSTPAAGLPAMPGANLPGLPGLPAATTPPIDPVYNQLVNAVATNLNTPANPTGKINDEWVVGVLKHFGVADGNLQNAAHNPAACQQALDYMKSQGLAV